ncbi:putative reverse transcriptase domain-containing protein [Tanacetum coccineum]
MEAPISDVRNWVLTICGGSTGRSIREADMVKRRIEMVLGNGHGWEWERNPKENNIGARPNSHKRTVGTEAAFSMSWRKLMKLIAEVYCPRNEIQKMESELWNLTVKNNDLAAYTHEIQEIDY